MSNKEKNPFSKMDIEKYKSEIDKICSKDPNNKRYTSKKNKEYADKAIKELTTAIPEAIKIENRRKILKDMFEETNKLIKAISEYNKLINDWGLIAIAKYSKARFNTESKYKACDASGLDIALEELMLTKKIILREYNPEKRQHGSSIAGAQHIANELGWLYYQVFEEVPTYNQEKIYHSRFQRIIEEIINDILRKKGLIDLLISNRTPIKRVIDYVNKKVDSLQKKTCTN